MGLKRKGAKVIYDDGKIIRIGLTQNREAIIDRDDYEIVAPYQWRAQKTKSGFYALWSYWEQGRHIAVLMHRLIMSPPDDMEIDHIDNDGLNNRKSNLRIVSRAQNRYNARPNFNKTGTSKFKGVSWQRDENKWLVQIQLGHKTIHIGRFKDEIEAARAYDKKAKEVFGEYAWTNFK